MTAIAERRACMDCKHRIGRTWPRCERFPLRFDKVLGFTRPERNCEAERSRFWRWLGSDVCGPEGRYWEAMSPRPAGPAPRPSR